MSLDRFDRSTRGQRTSFSLRARKETPQINAEPPLEIFTYSLTVNFFIYSILVFFINASPDNIMIDLFFCQERLILDRC